MYQPIDPRVIRQGDILEYFYFTFFQKDKLQKISTDGVRTQLDYSARNGETNFETVNKCLMLPAIIVTQTCDTQRRDYIQICPIFTLHSYELQIRASETDEAKVTSKLASLKGNKMNYYYFLESFHSGSINLEESYVDLQFVNSIQRSIIDQFPRMVSFTDKAAHWFSYALMNYFGRPYQ